MREIKFRAWDGEMMNYNVCVNHLGEFIKSSHRSTDWSSESKAGIGMQYTGLKDKNGKEIYEGDILAFYSELNEKRTQIAVVIFFDGAFIRKLFEKQFGETDNLQLTEDSASVLEVIGNTHENPELLQVAK